MNILEIEDDYMAPPHYNNMANLLQMLEIDTPIAWEKLCVLCNFKIWSMVIAALYRERAAVR